MTQAAAFLDRDGVINFDRGYVGHWEDFEFIPGAIEALGRLQAAAYLLVLVSNQSGIARGFYTEADVEALHAQMQAVLAAQGVQFARIAYCPHLPADEAKVAAYARVCDCRKPAPGMFLAARDALNIEVAASVMFGDKTSDVEAARRSGVAHAVLIDPTGTTSQANGPPASACVKDLSAGVDWWLARGAQATPK